VRTAKADLSIAAAGNAGMVEPKKIGFAVVGLGNIARSSVIPAFGNCKKAKLIAFVGRDQRATEELAGEYGVSAAYHARQFANCLAHPAVDAVYIATPQASHLHYTTMAAKAGKHVLCEKPLAATVQQSAKMVKVCRQSGVRLMTAYRKHFEPSALHLKRLIVEGELGRVDVINTAFSENHVAGVSPAWMLEKKEAGGGPLMDLGVYCVNTSRWLVEEDPVRVSAASWRHDRKRFRSVEEGISFRMHFASGLVVQGSSTYSSAISSFLFVQGSKGWASLSPAFPFDEERHLCGKIGGKWFSQSFPVIDEFAPEVDELAASIQERRSVHPDGAQGHRDMILLRAIYESAKKGKAVGVRYQ
jgi:predicted dehydrogenase